MKSRVLLSYGDYFCYRVKDAKEAIDFFGEDYLMDYGVDVEPELLTRYQNAMREYKEVQAILAQIYTKLNSQL